MLTENGLTDEHRAHIEAALPDGVTMSPEAWSDLAEIIDGYRLFERRRTSYPIKEERARWKRLGDAVEQARVELRRLRRKRRGPILIRCGPTVR
jgi:hypothetical protein